MKSPFKLFNPRNYLNQYYGKIGCENEVLLNFFIKAYQNLDRNSLMLEFSGGPTIYSLIPVVHRVKEIHFSDHLKSNLKEVILWQQNSLNSFNWSHFFKRTFELEYKNSIKNDINNQIKIIKEREKNLKSKITKYLYCDAFQTHPLGSKYHNFYDLLNVNFVAESITSSKRVWHKLIVNICSLLKKNGILIITALKEAKYYRVGQRLFPAVSITEADVKEILSRLGFSIEILETAIAENPDERSKNHLGYKGFILVKAKNK